MRETDSTCYPQSFSRNESVGAEDNQPQGVAAPDIKDLIGQCTGKVQTLKDRCSVLVEMVKEDIVKSKNYRQPPATAATASLPRNVKAGYGTMDRMVRKRPLSTRHLSMHEPPFATKLPISQIPLRTKPDLMPPPPCRRVSFPPWRTCSGRNR